MSELRIKLDGEKAQLGRVSAADVAQLILGVEKAAAQAAAVVLGRPKTTSGRYQGVIEEAVRFKLVSVEDGSVVPVLELPDLPSHPGRDEFDLEVSTLGQTAISALLDAVEEHGPQPSHPLISKALLDVSERLHIGERYEAIVFDDAPSGSRPRRCVRIDRSVRARLGAYVEQANARTIRSDDLTGVLFEADFERRTARLRTSTQGVVEILFAAEHDDNIQTALRQSSTVRGEVAYDPQTRLAKSVRLTKMLRGIEQLALDSGAFWREMSFEGLAADQGSGDVVDPVQLVDADASEQERDSFMAAIAELA
jgi:hypothetical protein